MLEVKNFSVTDNYITAPTHITIPTPNLRRIISKYLNHPNLSGFFLTFQKYVYDVDHFEENCKLTDQNFPKSYLLENKRGILIKLF